jgi:hypothetical protein
LMRNEQVLGYLATGEPIIRRGGELYVASFGRGVTCASEVRAKRVAHGAGEVEVEETEAESAAS